MERNEATEIAASMAANELLMGFICERVKKGEEMQSAISGALQDERAVIERNLTRIMEAGYVMGGQGRYHHTERASELRHALAMTTYNSIRQGSRA